MTLLLRRVPLDEIVKKIVAALQSAEESSGPARLVEAVYRVRDQADLVRAHLQFLLSDPNRIAQAAQCAYWHVNGFLKLRLASNDRFCLRLHIWPSGPNRRGDTEPHSHRWDFASWVAVGPGLLETYFTRTHSSDPGASAHVHYDYGRAAEDEPRLQSGLGVAWLRQEDVQERTAGAVYDCAHHMIHTVAPLGSDLIATVLLQGPKVTETTAVYRPFGTHVFDNLQRPVGTGEFAGLIGAVCDALTDEIPK